MDPGVACVLFLSDRLPPPLPTSCQVVLQTVHLRVVQVTLAIVKLGRHGVLDVKGFLFFQAGFQGVLKLLRGTGVILNGEGARERKWVSSAAGLAKDVSCLQEPVGGTRHPEVGQAWVPSSKPALSSLAYLTGLV